MEFLFSIGMSRVMTLPALSKISTNWPTPHELPMNSPCMEYLKKVEGERYLYSHENADGTHTYFVRRVENGKGAWTTHSATLFCRIFRMRSYFQQGLRSAIVPISVGRVSRHTPSPIRSCVLLCNYQFGFSAASAARHR